MNTNQQIVKQWEEQEALHRFQLISPLLCEDLDNAKKLQLRKKIAEENDITVRSLYRYEKAYREGQFSGLKPATRKKHRSQRLPKNFEFLVEQPVQLRKEVPERSVAQIILILEMEGHVAPGVLKRPTLERHLYKRGFGSIYADENGTIRIPAQYRSDVTCGENVKALAVSVYNEGVMSNDRIASFLNADGNGELGLSEGSFYGFCKEFARASGIWKRCCLFSRWWQQTRHL